jgi:hypothetical protein
MIYNHHNSLGASVHDVDTLERLHGVISVDDREGIVTRHVWPVRLDHTGEVTKYETRYQSIYPIFGDSHVPVMFHCYGRKN